MSPTAHSSWGSGWPNCNGGAIDANFSVDGTRFPGGIRHELVDLVTMLVRETKNRGYRFGTSGDPSYGCWGYSCFAGDTLVLTPDGDVPIRDLVGTQAKLLTTGSSKGRRPAWVTAPVRSFGVQSVFPLTVKRAGVAKTVWATAEHRWLARRRDNGGWIEKITSDLLPADTLVSAYPWPRASRMTPSTYGIAHGLVFGDGTRDMRRGGTRIALHGTKNAPLERFFSEPVMGRYQYGVHAEDHGVITGLPAAWKEFPSERESARYLYGFLAGWFAADGTVSVRGGCRLSCANREALELARSLCTRLGIATYAPTVTKRIGYGQEVSELWEMTLATSTLDSGFFLIDMHRERWNEAPRKRRLMDWHVVEVGTQGHEEEVFCAVVPETETFTLADNLLTGNCRAISGSSTPSNHSWGLAVDINAPSNPYTSPLVTDMPSWMPDLWNAYGFRWGGDYTGSQDAMHYEFMGSVQDAANETAKARANGLGGGSSTSPPTGDWFDMATEEDLRRIVGEEIEKRYDSIGVAVWSTSINSRGAANAMINQASAMAQSAADQCKAMPTNVWMKTLRDKPARDELIAAADNSKIAASGSQAS